MPNTVFTVLYSDARFIMTFLDYKCAISTELHREWVVELVAFKDQTSHENTQCTGEGRF